MKSLILWVVLFGSCANADIVVRPKAASLKPKVLFEITRETGRKKEHFELFGGPGSDHYKLASSLKTQKSITSQQARGIRAEVFDLVWHSQTEVKKSGCHPYLKIRESNHEEAIICREDHRLTGRAMGLMGSLRRLAVGDERTYRKMIR